MCACGCMCSSHRVHRCMWMCILQIVFGWAERACVLADACVSHIVCIAVCGCAYYVMLLAGLNALVCLRMHMFLRSRALLCPEEHMHCCLWMCAYDVILIYGWAECACMFAGACIPHITCIALCGCVHKTNCELRQERKDASSE